MQYVVLRNRYNGHIIYMRQCWNQKEIQCTIERYNINLDKSKYEVVVIDKKL